MSDDWDFYPCLVDSKPASIFLDLGVAQEAPDKRYPVMAYVRLYMRDPREDGLSSSAEFETLTAIEDVLVRKLISEEAATFVGRNTSDGCRDFYFYSRSEIGWTARVEEAMAAFGDYEFDSGARPDSGWRTYFDFLFPRDRDLQSIQNRRVCEALRRNGDSLSTAREIDHWAYFDTEDARERFIESAAKLEFEVRSRLDGGQEDDRRYGVQIFRKDVPDFSTIDQTTWPLFEAAAEVGGEYDGWESVVVASNDAASQ